jgi:hypothetical protein
MPYGLANVQMFVDVTVCLDIPVLSETAYLEVVENRDGP